MPYLHSPRYDETRDAFYEAIRGNDVREIVRIYTYWKHDSEWCSTAYLLFNDDRQGRVPLAVALEAGQLEATRVLLLLGALSEFAGPDERDLLNHISPDRFDLVWAIVTHERESTEAKRAARALHFAARRNNILLAEELLQRNVAVDGKAAWSRGTPLTTAVSCANEVWRRQNAPEPDAEEDNDEGKRVGDGFHPMIELLLRHGADVGAEAGEAIRDAARYGNVPLVELLRTHGATYTLSAAVMLGDTDGVRRLVETGADIETPTTPDDPGETPLTEAASGGHREIVAYLLSQGANVRPYAAKDNFCQPLVCAVGRGFYDVAALLCDYGAATDNVDAMSPAIESGDEQMVRLLIRSGVPVDGTDFLGRTPLQVAAEHGRDGIAELLRAHGGAT